MTRRYEKVRHAAFFARQTFRPEPCHSGGQLSGGLGSVPNRAASRPIRVHRDSMPTLDVQPSLQGRTNAPDGPARPGVDGPYASEPARWALAIKHFVRWSQIISKCVSRSDLSHIRFEHAETLLDYNMYITRTTYGHTPWLLGVKHSIASGHFHRSSFC